MGMGVFDQLYTAANENVSDISAILRDFNKTDYDTDLAEIEKSDKQYKIGSDLKVTSGLNDKVESITQPIKTGTNEPAVQVINKIGKSYSYVDAIDSLVINAMSDFKLDDYLDDYDNNGIYDDLITLRRQLIQERGISVDVVKNLSAVEEHTADPGFIEKIEEVLPA